jgi:hypothetical protein
MLEKGNTIPARVREGPQGSEASRHPHPFTNGDEDVSPTYSPPFTPRKVKNEITS